MIVQKIPKLLYKLRLILIPTVLFSIHATLIDHGFCYSTGKFFSQMDQEELINRGVKKLIDKHQPYPVYLSGINGNYKYTDPIIPYKSIEEFKKLNPFCCSFHKGELGGDWQPEPFLKIITGEIYGYIYLEYITRRKYPNNIPKEVLNLGIYPQTASSVTALPVDTCGNIKTSKKW